jgi:hypothetical protein
MKWNELKQSIVKELQSKRLADPKRRISALNKVESIMNEKCPQYIRDTTNFAKIEKDDFKKLIEKAKGKVLNGAENSVINEIYNKIKIEL